LEEEEEGRGGEGSRAQTPLLGVGYTAPLGLEWSGWSRPVTVAEQQQQRRPVGATTTGKRPFSQMRVCSSYSLYLLGFLPFSFLSSIVRCTVSFVIHENILFIICIQISSIY
jgi:hypothetical protein